MFFFVFTLDQKSNFKRINEQIDASFFGSTLHEL